MIYHAVVTALGRAKIAQALATGAQLNFSTVVLGDGQGVPVTVSDNQTQLVRQVWETAVNQVAVSDDHSNRVIVEAVVPAPVGGWVVREVGLKDDDGDLIAVSGFPATYKATLEEGPTQDLVIRILLIVADAAAISVQINPAVVTATRAWVVANYLSAPGGTTGQMIRKRSNADHDVEWFNLDIEGLNIQFDTIEEVQELAANQTVVNWATIATSNAGYYINGERLRPGEHFNVTGAAQITLTAPWALPAKIHGVQNDQAAGINAATETTKGLVELADNPETLELVDGTRAVTPKGLGHVITEKGFLQKSDNLAALPDKVQAQKNLQIFDYIPKAMCLLSMNTQDLGNAYYYYEIPANSSQMRVYYQMTGFGTNPVVSSDPKRRVPVLFAPGNKVRTVRITGNGPATQAGIVTGSWSGLVDGLAGAGFFVNVAPQAQSRSGTLKIELLKLLAWKNVIGVVRTAEGRAWVNFTSGTFSASKRQYLMPGAMWARGTHFTPSCNLNGAEDPAITPMFAALRIESYDDGNFWTDPDLVPLHFLEV